MTPFRATSLTLALGLLAACGGEKPADRPGTPAATAQAADLTPFQLEHGIGPVTEAITLGPLDHDLAERGEDIFETKCSACHKMDTKYVGPALGDVTVRRSPAYIMNMILNPTEMYTRHPVARQLLAETMTQMPDLSLTREDARAVLEYLRTRADKDDH